MLPGHNFVSRLRDPNLSAGQRLVELDRFARITGWRPSYEIDYPETRDVACGHLFVEHGLQPVVAITFLRLSQSFEILDWSQRNTLLSISYNNLVDWHVFPDRDGLWVAHNRTKPVNVRYIPLAQNPNAWMVEEFEKLIGRRPSPNFPGLDDALIKTVSDWKRILAGELATPDITEPISELFNAIFFVRALEDYRRKDTPNTQRALLDQLDRVSQQTLSVRSVLAAGIQELKPERSVPPLDMWDDEKLKVFDALSQETVREIVSDFYDNRFAPYRYDFSLISKHALSRIYEHYISQLKVKVPDSPRLFPEPSEEVPNREIGGYYTPFYIARFFARFLSSEHTPPRFRDLKAADPACGSGMFLRTLLEMQCDPIQRIDVAATAAKAFANVLGIDVEPNACKATRLSLSLLHLVLTGEFPTILRIENDEALSYVSQHAELAGTFDAVVANPPFVKWENIPETWQQRITPFMAGYEAPKADLYLVFVKLGLQIVKPGGFLLFVLPHSFLLSRNARVLRRELSQTCWVRFLADLSDIEVFGEASAYPILLILQKRQDVHLPPPEATIVRCTAYPGRALEEALEGRITENEYFSIYTADQKAFRGNTWRVAGPEERRLGERILRFPKLDTFVAVKQGFITGADRVFIRDKSEVPGGEEAAYIPYLSDREMHRYRIPRDTKSVVFYPFDGDRPLTEADVRARFPKTWEHIESHSERLKARRSLSRVGAELWWRPLWPRPPMNMLRPKIVSPHLILFPRFGLDVEGKFGVSHSPMLMAREATDDDLDLLRYCLGVLNSSVGLWQVVRQSSKYQRGYAMLEVNTLRGFSIPSPATVPPMTMNAIQEAVARLIGNPSDQSAEDELNRLVNGLYGIRPDELREVVVPGAATSDEDG